MAPTLLVFLKAPVPGRVKTRLAREIGPERAAGAYREMAGAIRDALLAWDGAALRWVYDPSEDFPDLDWLELPGAPLWLQGAGSLGERLERAFARAHAEKPGPVCAIGTDSPGLPTDRLREAFAALAERDAVAGPTEDGGYYLLGTARHRPELFRGIPWSTERVLEATRARAAETGLSLGLLPPYFDVDTEADYRRWKSPAT